MKALLLWLYLPVALLLAITYAVGAHLEMPFFMFTRDPLQITRGNPLWGMLSSIGILFWCAAATVCISGALTGVRWGMPRRTIAFLAGGGILTTLLLFDDLFMLHEIIYPTYFKAGEKTVYLAYGLLLVFYLLYFRTFVRQTDWPLLFVAVALFGLSTGIDQVWHKPVSLHHLIEDGAKLMGIVSWCAYFWMTAQAELDAALQARSRRPQAITAKPQARNRRSLSAAGRASKAG